MYESIVTNSIPKCEATVTEGKIASLTERMNDAHVIARDALTFAMQIGEHLFGAVKCPEEKCPIPPSPESFSDKLAEHNACLTSLCNELARIKALLGV